MSDSVGPRSLVLLSAAVLLLSACGAGYDYNPREIDCRTLEAAWLCAPNFRP